MSRRSRYCPVVTPATPAGWERAKAALAALRQQGYSAGLTARSSTARAGSKGAIYATASDARRAEETGLLTISYGAHDSTYDEATTYAIGRAACAAFTAAGALWWWDGNPWGMIYVNVGHDPQDYAAAERTAQLADMVRNLQGEAQQARTALADALRMRLDYYTITSHDWHGATELAKVNPGAAQAAHVTAAYRFERERTACVAALAAYNAAMDATACTTEHLDQLAAKAVRQ